LESVAPSTIPIVKHNNSVAAQARLRKSGETRLAGPDRGLKLPHERDESTEPPGPKRRVIRQAAKDLARGLIDTDNYTRAALVAAWADSRRRRGL
jgi:hypothetical protein